LAPAPPFPFLCRIIYPNFPFSRYSISNNHTKKSRQGQLKYLLKGQRVSKGTKVIESAGKCLFLSSALNMFTFADN